MGLGAIITCGDGNAKLDDQLTGWVIEVRVEQKLSEPTKVAIRFEDDLCDGGLELENRNELKAGQTLGLFVPLGSTLSCLCRGPITRVRTAAMTGGTGSWREVVFNDRRVELDRAGIQANYTGKESDAATTILQGYGFTPDVQATAKDYPETQKLQQRESDLAFLKGIARRNNMEFWLTYDVVGAVPPFAVTTNAKIRSSPPRSDTSATAISLPPLPPVLAPDPGRVIRINPLPADVVSVYRFEVRVDSERPNAARGFASDARSGTQSKQSATPADPPLDQRATTIVDLGVGDRTLLTSAAATDPLDQYLAQQAELTEAAWFVQVDASATLAQLGFVVEPHQVVDVQYAGDQLSGPYQVTETIHVINPANHLVDFKLRANGLRNLGAAA